MILAGDVGGTSSRFAYFQLGDGRLFVSLYGAEAGNLALKVKATGGLAIPQSTGRADKE